MSTIVATGHQIGLHANTLNNFTWYQPDTPNGTVLFGQGNYGNVATVVTFSNSTVTFATNTTFSGIATFSANTTFNGIATFSANTTFNGIATFSANTTFSANVTLSGGLVANGSVGTNGQILTSNGSTSYWATSTAATTGKAIAMAIVFGG